MLWQQIDPANKGIIRLSDFYRLAEVKTSTKSDPFGTKALDADLMRNPPTNRTIRNYGATTCKSDDITDLMQQ